MGKIFMTGVSNNRSTVESRVEIMDSEIIRVSENHRSYSDKSVNIVLISFDLPREDIALGKIVYYHFYQFYCLFF